MVGKPKGESQETYEALLDAAEHIFAERGVTRTTLNDVACSAGMTRGAVYWHFKDKGALVEALCDRVFLPMETMLNEISAAPEDDPIGALRGMMLEMLKREHPLDKLQSAISTDELVLCQRAVRTMLPAKPSGAWAATP